MVDEPLDQQATDMKDRSVLKQIQFSLSRIAKNVNLINSVPNAQLITVAGGDLFMLAAQYYSDAKKWILIARANNLEDPTINGITQLIIPPDNGQLATGL